MNIKILNSIAVLFAFAAFSSCKHNNFENFVGPALCPSSSFQVVQAFSSSSPQIDFNVSSADTLKAKFSEEVTWTIILKGNTSGATKTFQGRSMQIDTVWYGQSSDPSAFFQSGEDVIATMSVACLSNTYTTPIHIVNASHFNAKNGPFLLVSDFDAAGSNGFVSNSTTLSSSANNYQGYNSTGWSSYVTAPNILTKLAIGNNVSTLAPAHGNQYLTLQGTAGPNSWFVGGMYTNVVPALPGTDINNLYFNAFISSGDNITTEAGISLKVGTTNYTKLIPINWSGWKMVSIKLADFKDANGISVTSTSQILAIDFGLNCASKMGQSTELDLDFIVFSNGGPFFQ